MKSSFTKQKASLTLALLITVLGFSTHSNAGGFPLESLCSSLRGSDSDKTTPKDEANPTPTEETVKLPIHLTAEQIQEVATSEDSIGYELNSLICYDYDFGLLDGAQVVHDTRNFDTETAKEIRKQSLVSLYLSFLEAYDQDDELQKAFPEVGNLGEFITYGPSRFRTAHRTEAPTSCFRSPGAKATYLAGLPIYREHQRQEAQKAAVLNKLDKLQATPEAKAVAQQALKHTNYQKILRDLMKDGCLDRGIINSDSIAKYKGSYVRRMSDFLFQGEEIHREEIRTRKNY